MKDRIFIDSNIWVYLYLDNENDKTEIVEDFFSNNATKSVFATSCQIINEVCNVLKRHGFTEEEIRGVIEDITDTCPIHDLSKTTCLLASALREKYSLSFWDSIIVATAKTAGCNLLISEDMQDGLVLDGMRIKNIFR